jgi:hypothetical protein
VAPEDKPAAAAVRAVNTDSLNHHSAICLVCRALCVCLGYDVCLCCVKVLFKLSF